MNKTQKFVLFLPIIHAISQITTNYFDEGSFNTGMARAVILLIFLLVFFLKNKVTNNHKLNIVFIFIIYNGILIIFSEDIFTPLSSLLKLVISLLMIFVGMSTITNMFLFKKLLKNFIISLILLDLNYLIANIFDLGKSTYLDDSFYLGGASHGLTNEIALLVIVAIVYVSLEDQQRKRLFNIIVAILSIAIMLVVMRRGAFLTLGGGLLTFLFVSNQKKNMKYIAIVSIILLLISPLFVDLFVERLEFRAESRGGSVLNYENEARYMEIFDVIADIERGGILQALFGTHNMNSANYFPTHRELHVGYTAIFHGSGFVGIVLFLLIIIKLIKIQKEKKVLNSNVKDYRNINGLFYAVLVALLFYLISSRLPGFTFIFPFSLLIGSIYGVGNNKKNHYGIQ